MWRTSRVLGPLGDDATGRAAAAGAALATLIDLRDRGMCAPLPLFCANLGRLRDGRGRCRRRNAIHAPASAWTSGYQHRGEDQEAAHVRVWGGRAPWDAIAALEPAAGEAGDGGRWTNPAGSAGLAMRLLAAVASARDPQPRMSARRSYGDFDPAGPLPEAITVPRGQRRHR